MKTDELLLGAYRAIIAHTGENDEVTVSPD
jgi:hypothetical protein